MSKLTKQQRIATAKKKCRIMTALGSLHEAVERIVLSPKAFNSKERAQAKKVLNWTSKAMASLKLDIFSKGVSRDFNSMGNMVLAKRNEYVQNGSVDVVAGCIDVMVMAQLATDLMYADNFKGRAWTYLAMTSETLIELLMLDLQGTGADETAFTCALTLFDELYPDYISKIPNSKEAA